MGLSHTTLYGPDWRDVAEALEAFQQMNGVLIALEMHLDIWRGTPGLLLRGEVLTEPGVAVVPAVSVSVRLNSGTTAYRTMGAAVLNLLYQIDALLAARAWEGVEIK